MRTSRKRDRSHGEAKIAGADFTVLRPGSLAARRRQSNRLALTLVELCLVMAVITLTATVTTTLLHAMLRQQAASGKQLLAMQSVTRLTDRFRKDVRRAVEGHLDSAERITLVHPNDTVVTYSYRLHGAVRRTLQFDGETRWDEFDLHGDYQLSFASKSYSDSRRQGLVSKREPKALASGDSQGPVDRAAPAASAVGSENPASAVASDPKALASGDSQGPVERAVPAASAVGSENPASAVVRHGLIVLAVHPMPAGPAPGPSPGSPNSSKAFARGTTVIAELGRDHRWNGSRGALEAPRQSDSPPASTNSPNVQPDSG